MTLKRLIYEILLVNQECRNSDKKLQWRVLEELDLVDRNFNTISKDNFFKAPEFESIRRCRQALQRTDLLSGTKVIQPSENIKKTRVNMAKTKGYEYQQGKQIYTFNPVTQTYG